MSSINISSQHLREHARKPKQIGVGLLLDVTLALGKTKVEPKVKASLDSNTFK
jgi:hypothetical protein